MPGTILPVPLSLPAGVLKHWLLCLLDSTCFKEGAKPDYSCIALHEGPAFANCCASFTGWPACRIQSIQGILCHLQPRGSPVRWLSTNRPSICLPACSGRARQGFCMHDSVALNVYNGSSLSLGPSKLCASVAYRNGIRGCGCIRQAFDFKWLPLSAASQ